MRAGLKGNTKEVVGGALMAIVGAYAIIQGSKYNIGTLTRMGPGFFPVALGVILAFFGLINIVMAALSTTQAAGTSHPREWKAWACVLGGIIAFVVLGRYGGLVPASFAIVFISALGDRENGWTSVLVLSLVMTAISVVVFWWALKLQLPLFGWG